MIKIGWRAILRSAMGTLCEAICTSKTWGKAGVQEELDPAFGFTLTSDPNTASLICGGR